MRGERYRKRPTLQRWLPLARWTRCTICWVKYCCIKERSFTPPCHFAERNITYLPRTGISPKITRIVVNSTAKTVCVQMTTDVSPLFPEFLDVRPISAWGGAQVRISEP